MIFKKLFAGIVECNSFHVKHNVEIGSYTATCKKVSDLKDGDIVLVLEKMGDAHGNSDNGNWDNI